MVKTCLSWLYLRLRRNTAPAWTELNSQSVSDKQSFRAAAAELQVAGRLTLLVSLTAAALNTTTRVEGPAHAGDVGFISLSCEPHDHG